MGEESDRWLDEIVAVWPRLPLWRRKHILLICFYYEQRKRLETWLCQLGVYTSS